MHRQPGSDASDGSARELTGAVTDPGRTSVGPCSRSSPKNIGEIYRTNWLHRLHRLHGDGKRHGASRPSTTVHTGAAGPLEEARWQAAGSGSAAQGPASRITAQAAAVPSCAASGSRHAAG